MEKYNENLRREATPLTLAAMYSEKPDDNYVFISSLLGANDAGTKAFPFWFKKYKLEKSWDDELGRYVTEEEHNTIFDPKRSLLSWSLSRRTLQLAFSLLHDGAELMPTDPSPLQLIDYNYGPGASLSCLHKLFLKGMLRKDEIIQKGIPLLCCCMLRLTMDVDAKRALNMMLEMGFKVLSQEGERLIADVERGLRRGEYDLGHLFRLKHILDAQKSKEEKEKILQMEKRSFSASTLSVLDSRLPRDLSRKIWERVPDDRLFPFNQSQSVLDSIHRQSFQC